MALFTPEELAELKRIDAEIDDNFRQTQDEIVDSRQRDRMVIDDRKDRRSRKIADQQRAYREANREKIADQQRAYYEANREKIADQKRAWMSKNREKWNAYQREHRKRKKENRSPDGSPGNGTKDMNVS